MILTAPHWTRVDPVRWPWRYISPREAASKGDGSIRVCTRAMDMMTLLREDIGRPFYFWSIYRDPLHNARVGGAPLSRHKESDAFDIGILNHPEPLELYDRARAYGFTGFGFYRTFLHVDTWRPREWGPKWKWKEAA